MSKKKYGFPRSGSYFRGLAATCLQCGVYISENSRCKNRERFILSSILGDFISRIVWGSILSFFVIGAILSLFIHPSVLFNKTMAVWLFIIPLIPGAFHIFFIKKVPVNLPSALGEKALLIRIHFLIFSTFLLYLLPMLYEMCTRKFISFLYL